MFAADQIEEFESDDEDNTELDFEGCDEHKTDINHVVRLLHSNIIIKLNVANMGIDGFVTRTHNNLKKTPMDPNDALTAISAALGQNTSLKELLLSECDNLSFRGLQSLSIALKSNTALEKLTLSDANVKGIIHILGALIGHQSIKELDLSYLSKTNIIEFRFLCLFMARLIAHSNTLEKLNFSHQESYDAMGFAKILSAIGKNNSLLSLNLSSNEIKDFDKILSVFSTNNSLCSLDLSFCEIKQIPLKNLNFKNYSLKKLKLSHNPLIEGDSHHFSLFSNNEKETRKNAILELIKCFVALEELDISENKLPTKYLDEVIQYVKNERPNLRIVLGIDLRAFRVNDPEFQKVIACNDDNNHRRPNMTNLVLR